LLALIAARHLHLMNDIHLNDDSSACDLHVELP